MKKSPLNKIGKAGRINQKAARINRKWFDNQENKRCRVPGCCNIAQAPHHRLNRNAMKDIDPKKWLANLTDQKNIRWLCNSCHSVRPPASYLSEILWLCAEIECNQKTNCLGNPNCLILLKFWNMGG